MARGKNTPALFEVIRNAQQKQKEQLERQRQQQLAAEIEAHSPAGALLRSPLYWFKGKQAHEAAKVAEPVMREVPPAPVAMPTVGPVSGPPAAPAPRPIAKVFPTPEPEAFEPMPTEPTLVTAAESAPVEPIYVAPPAPAYAPTSAAAQAARQVREELAAQDAPAAEPLFASGVYDSPASPFGHDADEPRPPQFNLRFNYTTAAVAGFAIVTAFMVAYIIGTAGADSKAIASNNVQSANTKSAGVQSVVQPTVLNVGPGATPAPVAKLTPAVDEDDARASLLPANESLALETIGRPIAVPTSVKRVVGYQYLVLLSFPREEDAKNLVKYLAQNGVPATAERALPEYAKSWTSVVTARGFDRTKNNPAFDAYSATLKDLLLKYAGDSKFRKTFKIDVYTWRTAR